MYKVTVAKTGEYLAEGPYSSIREAQQAAIEYARICIIAVDSAWIRARVRYAHKPIPWKEVSSLFVIDLHIGEWIDTHEGRVVPEDESDDRSVVFIDKKGKAHLGKATGDGTFYDNDSETVFAAERVRAFLYLPESEYVK